MTRKKLSPKRPSEKAAKAIVSGRSVVVLHEKQGSRYFVVLDDEELFRTSLVILRGRLVSEWYPSPGDRPADLDYSASDVKDLPLSFREQACDRLREHGRAIQEWELASKLRREVEEACSLPDGRLAWKILLWRSNFENERVSLETAETEYPYFDRADMEAAWERSLTFDAP